MYIPAVVAVAEHFHRRQSLAMGICVCGTGVGTFLLAPAELYFLNRSDTRDKLTIDEAFFLYKTTRS